MQILIQAGDLFGSVVDHLTRPLTHAENVQKVLVVCRYPGPKIPKIEYHYPCRLVSKYAALAVIYQFFNLFYLSIFKKPDCILGYRLYPHGLISFIVAKLSRRPIILFLIGGIAELYRTGYRFGDELTKNLPWLGRALLKMLKHSDAITTTGSFTKNFLVNQGIDGNKIHPVINPCHVSRVQQQKVPKVYDVVSVGRLLPGKHIETLLYAVSRVKERHGDIRVCIVGDGLCRDELLKLAAKLGLNDNIDFVGFQKETAYYYNRSRVFVLSSEREGFPTVVMEAMAHGIPPVVSNCGDVIDIARDGFNSIVIPRYNDYEGFAEAIIRLLKDKKLYRKLSQNCLNTAGSISMEDVARKWQLILGILAHQDENHLC